MFQLVSISNTDGRCIFFQAKIYRLRKYKNERHKTKQYSNKQLRKKLRR
jgi:hypothetical protein